MTEEQRDLPSFHFRRNVLKDLDLVFFADLCVRCCKPVAKKAELKILLTSTKNVRSVRLRSFFSPPMDYTCSPTVTEANARLPKNRRRSFVNQGFC